MIPLGDKSRREQMILEAKINREHLKMGLDEGRKDEEHEMKMKKAEAELEALYQKMKMEERDREFKSEIQKAKTGMDMMKTQHDMEMSMQDRNKQSRRDDASHNAKMLREGDHHQIDLHKKAADAHMGQQLKYHSAKAKAASDPESPHDVPELDMREIPMPMEFKQRGGVAGQIGYEMGTRSVPQPPMSVVNPGNSGYQSGTSEVKKRVDSAGKEIKGNYVLTDSSKPPPTSPSTATLATAKGPQQRWEENQAAKGRRGYEHGKAEIPHPMTGKVPTNPEAGASDTVPAMLTPGEAVIPREAAQNPKNKAIIDALIQEGRAAQDGHTMPDGKMMAGKTHKFTDGVHGVPGYFEGTPGVDSWWGNQSESATADQEEEERRRKAAEAAQAQTAQAPLAATASVPETPELVAKRPEIPAAVPEVDEVPAPMTPSEATPDRLDKSQSQLAQESDARSNVRTEEQEAALGQAIDAAAAKGDKTEMGLAGNIMGGIEKLGGIFGLNPKEMQRMAAQAAAAKLMGYSTRNSINAGFRGASQQAQQRVAEEHKTKAEALAEAKLDARSKDALRAAEAKDIKDAARTAEKETKAAYQGAYKEEYSRLTKEEFLPEHEARAKADAYAKNLVTGKSSQAVEGGPQVSSGSPQEREGVYNGQKLVGQWAHAPSKPGNDFVVTDKNGATKQVPTNMVKVRGVDTPFVNDKQADGSYRQVPLQEYKEKHLNAGYGFHEMSQADTVQSRQRDAESTARANQSAAQSLSSHKMAIASHNLSIEAAGRAREAHASSMSSADRARENQAVDRIKANLPEYISGTDEKSKNKPDNKVNKDRIANAALLAARDMKMDPNSPAFIRMTEQAGHLLANDPKLSKTVSPEGFRKLLNTTIVSGLPDGGQLVAPVLPKGVDKMTPEMATKAAAGQIKFGERLTETMARGKVKDLDGAFNLLRADYNSLPDSEKKKWAARSEGSGMTPFMFRVNNLP